jgi:antirestriction protein ArdC
MPNPNELRQQITDRLIAALENNVVPWRCPWSSDRNAGRPANLVSKRAYSGINPLLLQLHAMTNGFQSRWWGTFDQIKELGGMVRRRPESVPPGHWGCQVVFMKPVSKATRDKVTGEDRQERFTVMRTYTVFNVDQADGEKLDRFRADASGEPVVSHPDYEPCDRLVEALGVIIREGGNRACYHRPLPDGSWPQHTAGDHIEVPGRSRFHNQANYWETVFHEVSHWAEVRLGWDHRKEGYAMGELVAEIAACMAATELGIPQGEDIENHAAYLASWLGAMKNDPSFVFRASTQASKVTDFLLGHVAIEQPVVAEG